MQNAEEHHVYRLIYGHLHVSEEAFLECTINTAVKILNINKYHLKSTQKSCQIGFS